VKKVEARLRKLGYPLDFRKLKAVERVPLNFSYSVVLVVREVFNWRDSDIFDMGNNAPEYSFVVKMAMKYLLSTKKNF